MPGSRYNANAYGTARSWLEQAQTAKAGLARLNALGVVWRRQARPDEIVEAAGQAEAAPPLPTMKAFRDKGYFLAGVVWTLAWAARRAGR